MSKASRTLKVADRSIGYSLVPAKDANNRESAIVYLYPLSGCSLVVSNLETALLEKEYRCSLLSVDRPDCGETSSVDDATSSTSDWVLDRINRHVEDTIEVLQHEGIQSVYVLGVCLGHPYGVELCRQLLQKPEDPSTRRPKLRALTLLAPFVSPASPSSWKIARWGAALPSSVLYGVTESLTAAGSVLMPLVLSPSKVAKLIPPEEQEACGWTEQDFVNLCEVANHMNKLTHNAKGKEARLGASRVWQAEVCDKFAEEVGCGLIIDDGKEEQSDNSPSSVIPIRIHASPHDKLASLASVEWVARRCYGNCEIVLHDEIHSHEAMTFFGGPPRNPTLLHKVAQEWGLCDSQLPD